MFAVDGARALQAVGGTALPAQVRSTLAPWVAALEPALVSPSDAARLVETLAEVERLAGAAKVLLAPRAVSSPAVLRDGAATSGADWLARTSGTTKAQAVSALKTGERLASQPQLGAAVRSGQLSTQQAEVIADAAELAPGATESLLDAVAAGASVGELRRHAAVAKAAALPDEEARHRAIHRSRYHRMHTSADGALEGHYRLTAPDGATLKALLEPFERAARAAARRDGRRELEQAYAADALLALAHAAHAGGSPSRSVRTPDDDAADPNHASASRARPGIVPGPPAKVIVRVDHAALIRGHTHDGELCDIAGVGPVPVHVVEEILADGDPFLAAVVTRGTDITSVVHLGRRPNALQRTALQARGIECQRRGCSNQARLETDHTVPWSITHHTTINELDLLCPADHHHKTHEGWALRAGRGKRPMVPPGHPDHPLSGPSRPTPEPPPPPGQPGPPVSGSAASRRRRAPRAPTDEPPA